MYFDNPRGNEHPVTRTQAHIHALYLKFFHFVRTVHDVGDISREIIFTLQGLFGADGAVFCYIHDEGARFSAAIGTLSHMQNSSLDVNSPRVMQFLENRCAKVFTREGLKDYIAMVMNARFESAIISPISIDEHPYGLIAMVSNRADYFQDQDAVTLYNASLYLSTLLKNRLHEISKHEIDYLDRLGAICTLVNKNLQDTLNELAKTNVDQDIFHTLWGHLDNLNSLADLCNNHDYSERIDILNVFNEILDTFHPRGISFQRICAENIPHVKGNMPLIGRIIRELLNNAEQALTYNPQPNPEIIARIYTLPGFVVIEIENTGDPVAPADERRLFEPIFSLWPGHKGLGLTCARFYALKMNGNIVYRSHPNRMNAFRFFIPDEQHTPQIDIF